MWNIEFRIWNVENVKPIKSFTDLEVWKEGHVFALSIYAITKNFPKEELFGLVSQMRRSAVSVTSNIAEGFGRQTYKEKVQFYMISRGSITELQNQLLIAKDVGYLLPNKFQEIALQSVKVHKLLNGLITKSKTYYH